MKIEKYCKKAKENSLIIRAFKIVKLEVKVQGTEVQPNKIMQLTSNYNKESR